MPSRRVPAAELTRLVPSGSRLFLPGSTGEPTAFLEAWLEATHVPDHVTVTTSFIPTVNSAVFDRVRSGTRLIGLFPHPASQRAVMSGASETLGLSYRGFVRALRQGYPVDVLVLNLSSPDERGLCSMGAAVEFVPELLKVTKRVLAVVNSNVPTFPGTLGIPFERIEAYCESDDALKEYAPGECDPLSASVGRNVAEFIEDYTTLQIGIGKIPQAVLSALTDRKGIRFHSGLITPGIVSLLESGALDSKRPSVSCALLGNADFYAWLRGRTDILVRGCEETHDAVALASLGRFVAVNSALEVDLLGQANLECIGNRMVSAPGGAPDFAYAASHADEGLSVVALPSTSVGGQSRIVAQFASGTPVALPSTSIDVVVTEHGAADVRGLTVGARAEAIASIAAPDLRDDLLKQWRYAGSKLRTSGSKVS